MEFHEALGKVTGICEKNDLIPLTIEGVDIVDLPDGLIANRIEAGHYIRVSMSVLIRDGEANQQPISANIYSSASEELKHSESHSFPCE